jgi:ribosome-associated protein YbcJ (S4-like RNA binding protein)
MRFRLNKYDDVITLESFLKAVSAHEDYQQIRFMIKDGKIWVNGEKEYARRRLLRAGDNVAFGDRYYTISYHRDDFKRSDERQSDRGGKDSREEEYDEERKTEKVFHNKRPLKWSEKKIKKKTKE